MGMIGYLRGNEAAALGAKLSKIQLMGAYPIPPSGEVMEAILTYISNGELKAGFVETEGEKSSHLVTYSGAAHGVRSFNATSGQGLAYMNEGLHMQVGQKIPAVIAVANRSIFSPHGMQPDHSDTASERDTGWIQFHCETIQEVIDTIIQAYKVTEHKDVMIPALVCYEGLFLSHSLERVNIPDQKEVDDFLPPYNPGELSKIEPDGLPMFTSFGMFENWFQEFKYIEWRAINAAKKVIAEVDEEFGIKFGRKYGGLIDPYLTQDAEVILITTGANTSTARFAVNAMRKAGKKVGVIKIRIFRPYPKEALCEALEKSKAKVVVVVDRVKHGAYTDEVRAALYHLKNKPLVKGFICGLNGRDLAPFNMIDMAMRGFEIAKKGFDGQEEVEYYFLRKRGDNGNVKKI